jgi:hypothetical protein
MQFSSWVSALDSSEYSAIIIIIFFIKMFWKKLLLKYRFCLRQIFCHELKIFAPSTCFNSSLMNKFRKNMSVRSKLERGCRESMIS